MEWNDNPVDFSRLPLEVMKDASQPPPSGDLLRRRATSAARALGHRGWTKDVAGALDFDTACKSWAAIAPNPRMGLLVWGAFGCGKTSLVRAVTRTTKLGTAWISCGDPEQVERLLVEDWPTHNRELLGVNIVIDDMGAESPKCDYGIRRELVGELICRYRLYGQGRLFVTTNLGADLLTDRYTMRVCSRLKDLTIPLHLTGGDKRQWTKGGAA